MARVLCCACKNGYYIDYDDEDGNAIVVCRLDSSKSCQSWHECDDYEAGTPSDIDGQVK